MAVSLPTISATLGNSKNTRGNKAQMTMAGTMRHAESSTLLLNTISSHFASVLRVIFNTTGTKKRRQSQPASHARRKARTTNIA